MPSRNKSRHDRSQRARDRRHPSAEVGRARVPSPGRERGRGLGGGRRAGVAGRDDDTRWSTSRPSRSNPEPWTSRADAVERLGTDDAIVILFEYDPASVQQPLFAAQGVPRSLDPDEFSPSVLQRTVRGQAGVQKFFQESGRAFCLYVVLGSFTRRHEAVADVNAVLASLDVGPRAPAPVSPGTIRAGTPFSIASRHPPTSGRSPGYCAEGRRVALLAGPGPFTLFAPDDDAFATVDLVALRQRSGPARRHAAATTSSPARYAVNDARPATSVTPLVGDPLPIAVDGRRARARRRRADRSPRHRRDATATCT